MRHMADGRRGSNADTMLGPLIFLLVVAGIVYWLFKASRSNEEPDATMEELRRQYARGEIDDEEFDFRRKKLRHHR